MGLPARHGKFSIERAQREADFTPYERYDLMSVDKYAICPCGNGKKIKFCKCKESIPEMDRVVSMVNGGQVVPALDRLSEILETHPDAGAGRL